MSERLAAKEALETIRQNYLGILEGSRKNVDELIARRHKMREDLDALVMALRSQTHCLERAVEALEKGIASLEEAAPEAQGNLSEIPGKPEKITPAKGSDPEPLFPEEEPTRKAKTNYKFFFRGIPYTNLRQACLHLDLSYQPTLNLVRQMGDPAKAVALAVERKRLRELRRRQKA